MERKDTKMQPLPASASASASSASKPQMTDLENLTRFFYSSYNLALTHLNTPNHPAALKVLSSLLPDARLPYMLRPKTQIALAIGYKDWFLAESFRLKAEETFKFIRDELRLISDTRVPGQDEQLCRLRWKLDQVMESQRVDDPRVRTTGRRWPGAVAGLYSGGSALVAREREGERMRVYSPFGEVAAEEKAWYMRPAPVKASREDSVWEDFMRFVAERSASEEDDGGDEAAESGDKEGQAAKGLAKRKIDTIEEDVGISLAKSKKRKRETDIVDFDALAKRIKPEIDNEDARMPANDIEDFIFLSTRGLR